MADRTNNDMLHRLRDRLSALTVRVNAGGGGASGPAPTVAFGTGAYADVIYINGVPGPHLTGPAGTGGETTTGGNIGFDCGDATSDNLNLDCGGI